VTNNTAVECNLGSINCRCSTSGTCDIGLHCNVYYTCIEDFMHNVSGYDYFLSGHGTVQKTVGYVSLSIVVSFFILLIGCKLLKTYVSRKVSGDNGVLLADLQKDEASVRI